MKKLLVFWILFEEYTNFKFLTRRLLVYQYITWLFFSHDSLSTFNVKNNKIRCKFTNVDVNENYCYNQIKTEEQNNNYRRLEYSFNTKFILNKEIRDVYIYSWIYFGA